MTDEQVVNWENNQEMKGSYDVKHWRYILDIVRTIDSRMYQSL